MPISLCLLRAEELAEIHVILSTGLLCAFRCGGMVAHRLDADATGADEAVHDNGRTGHKATDGAKDAAATAL